MPESQLLAPQLNPVKGKYTDMPLHGGREPKIRNWWITSTLRVVTTIDCPVRAELQANYKTQRYTHKFVTNSDRLKVSSLLHSLCVFSLFIGAGDITMPLVKL